MNYLNGANMVYSNYSDAGDLGSLDEAISGAGPHYDFTYTAAHELASETNTKSSYVWQPGSASTTSYAAANSLNQYPSVNGTPFAYDGKGNLHSDGTFTFSYDAENRLLTAVETGLSASYAYDPLGRRTHKSGTGVTAAYYLDDGDDEVVEYDGNKNVTALYVPGPAIDEPIVESIPNGDGTYHHEYFHTNHQGSVVAMSADDGTVAEGPFKYDPYGNCFKNSTPCAQVAGSVPYKFTGRRLDPETGCYYYRARYYCPDALRGGRFLQTDPVGYTRTSTFTPTLEMIQWVGQTRRAIVLPTCARVETLSAILRL